MTNGVTPRRWIHCANPALSEIFTKYLGPLRNRETGRNVERGDGKTWYERRNAWKKMKASKFELFIHLLQTFCRYVFACAFFLGGGWILSNKNPHFFWISSQGSQEWLTDMNKLKVERGVGHPVWSSPPKRPPCVEAMLQYKEDPKLHQESPWQQYDQKPVAATFHQKKMGGNLKMSGLDVITSRWMAMKKGCKAKLADWLKLTMDLEIDQDALIDIQSLGIFISIYWHLHPWCMWNYIFDIILYR